MPSWCKFFLCAVFSSGSALAGEPVKPLESRESWSLADESAWRWEGEGAASVLVLHRQSDFTPKVRSPRNLAWFTGGGWDSFELTAEVRLDVFNEGNNDLCIAFSKESETKFYYAHLGESADAVHLHLHKVDDKDREPITKSRAEKLDWKPETWHRVKLVRDAESGKIQVWFDDSAKPVLEATDKTLGKGAIGLGSFDDIGAFRNVVVKPRR